ncbi:protein of unknown function (plasmid) [Pararobbsia alpina]
MTHRGRQQKQAPKDSRPAHLITLTPVWLIRICATGFERLWQGFPTSLGVSAGRPYSRLEKAFRPVLAGKLRVDCRHTLSHPT